MRTHKPRRTPRENPLERPFAVFDIESVQGTWDQFLCAFFLSSDGEHQFFTKNLDELRAYVRAYRGRVYAHNGGKYDDQFLGLPDKAIMASSRLLAARFGKAQVWDSYVMMQKPLKDIAKDIGRKKMDDKSTRNMTDNELAARCRSDCEILLEALTRMRSWVAEAPHPTPRWPATAGATAIYLTEAWEPEHVAYLLSQCLDLDDWREQKNAVSGGKVEILHKLGFNPGPIHKYDINSSYPRSWVESPVPMGPWERVLSERKNLPGVYRCDVRENRAHPPCVMKDWSWIHDGECWATSEEISAVREAGGKVRVLWGWVSALPPGHYMLRTIGRLYEQKLAGNPYAKLTINAPHGKCGQDIETDVRYLKGVEWVDGKEEADYQVDYDLSLPQWFQRPLIGGFILARARIRLWRMICELKRRGWIVYYCDTDSVHTNCPPDQFPGEVSKTTLGAWKYEGCKPWMIYIAPKVYADDETVKSKGVPPDELTPDIMRQISEGWEYRVKIERGLVGFKQHQGSAKTRILERTIQQLPGKGKSVDPSGLVAYS